MMASHDLPLQQTPFRETRHWGIAIAGSAAPTVPIAPRSPPRHGNRGAVTSHGRARGAESSSRQNFGSVSGPVNSRGETSEERTARHRFKTALPTLVVLFGVAFASAQRAAPIDVADPRRSLRTGATARRARRQAWAQAAGRVAAGAGNFVGDAPAITCHATRPARTPRTDARSTSARPLATGPRAARACHGSGQAHVDGGGDPTPRSCQPSKVSPEQRERDVRDLSRSRPARAVGRQQARDGWAASDLPQRALAKRTAQLKARTNLSLRDLSPRGWRKQMRQPHAGARRHHAVLVLPQPARVLERPAAQDRRLGERSLLEVPCRQARPVPLGACARGESCTTCHDPHGSKNGACW